MSLSLRSELLRSFGFRHGFSLRSRAGGGASRPPYDSLNLGRSVGDDAASVAENHRLFAADVGYPAECLYEVTQVHGAALELVDPALAPASYRDREADALLSASAGCAVGIRVADCVPVLLADPASGAVAAVHAGWRGIVAGILEEAVRALSELRGAPADTLLGAVFPCIGLAAFEVGEEVAQRLAEHVGDPAIVQRGCTRPHVDLAASVRIVLARAELRSEHIEQVPGCTYAEPERFFSHRRDAGRTGRHLAVILPRC